MSSPVKALITEPDFLRRQFVQQGLKRGRKGLEKKHGPASVYQKNRLIRPLYPGTKINVCWMHGFRNRINPPGMKGVAFGQSLKCQP